MSNRIARCAGGLDPALTDGGCGRSSLKWVGGGSSSLSGHATPLEAHLHLSSVVSDVTGDRHLRAPSLPQRVCFHVFSLCAHGAGLLRAGPLDSASIDRSPVHVMDPLCPPGRRAVQVQ